MAKSNTLRLILKTAEHTIRPKIQKLFKEKVFFKKNTKIDFISEQLIGFHFYSFIESLCPLYNSLYSKDYGKKTVGAFIGLFFNIKNEQKKISINSKAFSLFIEEHLLLLQNMFYYSGRLQSKDVDWIKSEALVFKRYYGRSFLSTAHNYFKKDVDRAIKEKNLSIVSFLTSFDGNWIKHPSIAKVDARYLKTLKRRDEKKQHLNNRLDAYTYILSGFYGVTKKEQFRSLVTKEGLLTLPKVLYKEMESRALTPNKKTKEVLKKLDAGNTVDKLDQKTKDLLKTAGRKDGRYIQKKYSKLDKTFRDKVYKKSLDEKLSSIVPKYNKQASTIINDCYQARMFMNQDYSTKIPTPVCLDSNEVRLLIKNAKSQGLHIDSSKNLEIRTQKRLYKRLKSLVKKTKKV
jgi:hypothetical protein